MTDVVVKKLNDTYMRVECLDSSIEMDVSDRFSFKIKNAKHDPRVRAGKWNGIKRLYNRQRKTLYVGLMFELLKFIKSRGYSYTVDKELLNRPSVALEDVKSVVNDFIMPHDRGKVIEPYDYQYDAVHYMLNMNRSICLAATSAGKSLIIYLAARFYQLADEMEGKRIIIIVPSKMLVEQLYDDFDNYSTFEGSKWNAKTFCQKVSGNYDKNIKKQIVITTWQSLKLMPTWVMESAGAIFVDEVHTVSGAVLTGLLERATTCNVRHGLTGTLNDMEVDQLAAQGLLGPAKRIVTAREIIDSGRATEVEVYCTILDYDRDTKKRYWNGVNKISSEKPAERFQFEVEFVNELKSRQTHLQKMISTMKGNTIVLFDRVEYGKLLYEDMKSRHEDTYLIVGDVKDDERESIKKMLEGKSGCIVYATSKIMSTGVSIKNLHNAVLASSSKAKIRILQTIGRLMRLHESKEKANIFDIVDRLDLDGKENYTLLHVEERVKMYASDKYKVNFFTFKLVEPDEKRIELSDF